MFAAEDFFRQAVARQRSWPSKINLDGNAATHRALLFLRRQDPRWQSVVIRSRRYLNNIVEQDHRAIKRRCASMLGTTVQIGGYRMTEFRMIDYHCIVFADHNGQDYCNGPYEFRTFMNLE